MYSINFNENKDKSLKQNYYKNLKLHFFYLLKKHLEINHTIVKVKQTILYLVIIIMRWL